MRVMHMYDALRITKEEECIKMNDGVVFYGLDSSLTTCCLPQVPGGEKH